MQTMMIEKREGGRKGAWENFNSECLAYKRDIALYSH